MNDIPSFSVVCINILLKQKPTLKNRVASILYKRALLAPDFKATVTSRHYGEWLNGKMGIDVNERREKAAAFHAFLKKECNETAFAATVKQLVEA